VTADVPRLPPGHAQARQQANSEHADLLFASSGIENEIVASADRLEVLPRLTVPVATTAYLRTFRVLRSVAAISVLPADRVSG
jgi:hypothetical protein